MRRLAAAGADYFICPDNTAHLALELPGDDLALPGLHIAEVVAERAERDGGAASECFEVASGGQALPTWRGGPID